MKSIAIFGNAMQLYYASIYPCCTKIVLYILTDLIGWFTLITVYNKCVPLCVRTFYSDACIQIYMVNTLSTYKCNCNIIIELSYIPCAWLTLITTIIMMTHVWPRCRKILALALLFILSWRCTVSTSVCIHAQSSLAPLLVSRPRSRLLSESR